MTSLSLERVRPIALLAIFIAAAVASAAGLPTFTLWCYETCHILIVAAVLAVTRPRFQFTWITYITLLVLSIIVFLGAHYTYALVPIGEWMKQALGFSRNHFDRIGHFFQGVAPAMFVRELLIRRLALRRGPAVFWIVCGLCLGMAALFELLEWQFAMTRGGAVVDDLGAQGDPWDAQQDMLMALVGAIVAQLTLSRWQDRQISQLHVPRGAKSAAA